MGGLADDGKRRDGDGRCIARRSHMFTYREEVQEEGGLSILPDGRADGFKIHVFFVVFFWLRFFDVFSSIFGRIFVDFRSQIHRKTYEKIDTISGVLFHSEFVALGDARTLKIVVLPRKNNGF